LGYKNEIVTRVLSKVAFKTEFDSIINLLGRNHIDQVEILFGYAWGNEYRDWIPFEIKLADIVAEIDKPQMQNLGQLGRDDFYIILPKLEMAFLFCHERDIHLLYNFHHTIVSAVTDRWNAQLGLIPL
jgi:hypothetical protein